MKYLIIEREHWDMIDFDECNESSIGDVQRNDYRCIVSFNNDHPKFCYTISNDNVGLVEYDTHQIVQHIVTPEWNHQN